MFFGSPEGIFNQACKNEELGEMQDNCPGQRYSDTLLPGVSEYLQAKLRLKPEKAFFFSVNSGIKRWQFSRAGL